MNRLTHQLTHSKSFQTVVSVVIILCSIVLGIETFYPEHQGIFDILDICFTFFFLAEIVIRIVSEKTPIHFFRLMSFKNKRIHVDEDGFWNWFDFLIVVVSVTSLFQHLFEHPEFLVVSRLFRVLRVLRLLEVSKELKAVEHKIVSIIPTIFSFALLLGILLYIYSIVGIYLFGHHQYKSADFTSLGHAFITLFQLMTLDGWSEMMYAASASYNDSWLIKGYFISFVILTAIVSFNVFVAVLTSQVHEKFVNDQKMNKSKLSELQGDIQDTEQELQAGFKQVLRELQLLREEVERLRSNKG
ncbi:MAG: ion transporter [Bacteroidota bacterium]|jgi:voltage-gated sodium channel|nr:ion transporter [Cytophagales bacterium]MCE2958184.1 ion transporter [Flammeovirgaceae bacterium]MCZ8069208.1 ion transporter [Cytophagales bacterium]